MHRETHIHTVHMCFSIKGTVNCKLLGFMKVLLALCGVLSADMMIMMVVVCRCAVLNEKKWTKFFKKNYIYMPYSQR